MSIEYASTPIVVAPAAGSSAITLTPPSPGGPGASFYQNSAWSTVIASTANAIVLVGVYVGGGPQTLEIDIGTGGAGSEVVVGTITRAGQQRTYYFPIPIDNVGAGVRVAARIRGVAATAARIRLLYYNGTGLVGFTATARPSLVFPVTAQGGTPIDAPSALTAWNSGAWTTLVASTAADYLIAAVMCSVGASASVIEHEVDLGVGGAGSEVVKSTHRGTHYSGSFSGVEQALMKPPYSFVPSGSRIATRIRAEAGGIQAFRVFFHAYQVPL